MNVRTAHGPCLPAPLPVPRAPPAPCRAPESSRPAWKSLSSWWASSPLIGTVPRREQSSNRPPTSCPAKSPPRGPRAVPRTNAKRHAGACRVIACRDVPKKWSRGDSNPRKSGDSNASAADDAAIDAVEQTDDDLRAVMSAWPTLPDALKAAVLAVVRSHRIDGPQALPGEPRGSKGSGPERPLDRSPKVTQTKFSR